MRLPGLVLFLLGLLNSPLYAQKPVAARDFEFGQSNEELSRLTDNQRVDAETGIPLAIYQSDFPLTASTAEEMAREYLLGQRAILGLSETEIAELEVYFVREGLASTTVRLRQQHQGIPVHQAEIAISISPQKTVSYVANKLAYGLAPLNTTASISAQQARAIVADYIQLGDSPHFEEQELVIFPEIEGGRLTQRVVIASHQPMGEWEAFVNAQSGELLKVTNTSCYHHHHPAATAISSIPPKAAIPPAEVSFMLDGTGNVFDPDPLAAPNATYGQTGYVDNSDNNSSQLLAQQVSVTLPDITFSGGQYRLVGPYAEIVDTESPFRGTFAQATPNWNFNRQNNAFEAANVYYHIDASMRYLNEDIGVNVMPTQYTGGARFDPSGLNNADNSHYTGGNGVVAFGDGGVDDAEDSDVVHHELGHALHDWITGENLSQVNGLSEGCGDYWAVSYNRSLGFWNSSQAPYNWVFRWDGHNQFWGGRNVNTTKTYPNNLVGQVHTDGGIWAAAMMQVWDAIGKANSDRIFWEGLAMTTSNTNQNDAANAVYTAAGNLGLNDTDRLAVHTIFTNRGYTLPPFVALPVELLSFEGRKVGSWVELNWVTVNEENNDRFIVERSLDGRDFYPIGQLAGAGNSSINQRYLFEDREPALGTNIYRLQQIDFDGSSHYSKLVSIEFTNGGDWSISPNPITGEQLQILAGPADLSTAAEFSITDLQGRVLAGPLHLNNDGQINLGELPSGIYLLRMMDGSRQEVKRFVKR